MRERAVGVKIRVARGMVRAVDGLAARAGAARDAGYEEGSGGEAVREQRYGGQQCRSSKAAGMRDMRGRRSLQVLGYRAGELRQPRRGAMRVLVDGLVGVVAA